MVNPSLGERKATVLKAWYGSIMLLEVYIFLITMEHTYVEGANKVR